MTEAISQQTNARRPPKPALTGHGNTTGVTFCEVARVGRARSMPIWRRSSPACEVLSPAQNRSISVCGYHVC
jgi:hypothetical protein